MEPGPRPPQLAHQPLTEPVSRYAQRSTVNPARCKRSRLTLRITQRCSYGGVLSPCLSNVYLDRLDQFVETILMAEYNRGVRRKPNPEYHRVQQAALRARRRGDDAAVRELRKRQRNLPSMDPHDPGYRRLRYVRYADDILLGFTGPKAEAEEIKRQLAQFLHENLKLELSETKTLITHARTQAARFLGYEIITQ